MDVMELRTDDWGWRINPQFEIPASRQAGTIRNR